MEKYIFLLVIFVTLITSQVLKFIIESIQTKKINIFRLFDGSGGMPSTHSSLVSSLTMTIYLLYGVDNPLFAISLVFSLITMYDAVGIRFEAGKQAEAINELNEKIKQFRKRKSTKLKEQIGHQPIEVLAGLLLGITISFILVNLIY